MKACRLACLFLFTCLLWQTGRGQAFSKLYIEGRPSMLFGSVQTINDKFYVTGVTTTIRNPYYQKALFGKINGDGSVAFINSIRDSDIVNYDIFLNSLKKSADGNFIATGNVTDSVQRAFLMKVDTNGNILLWQEYTEAGNLIFQGDDVVEVPDSGYLLAVNICRSDYTSDVMLIRTDKSGNVLNKTDYYNGVRAIPEVIRSMFNGHYMVGAYTGKPNDNTPYWAKTWLLEVDRMGNMVRDWTDTSKKNLWPNGMEQTADSGWIIVRQHLDYDVSNFQAFNGSVLKLDKNFNKQWEIDTGGIAQDAGLYDVKILNDGNYICAGANPIDINQDSSHIYGWLMKASQNGEILWQRFYLQDSSFLAFSYLNAVEVLPDGGFVACGKVQDGVDGQQGWIIRTDSNGCLLDNCGRVSGIETVSEQVMDLKIYPNPATNLCKLETDAPHPMSTASVYDALGRQVMCLFNNQQLSSCSFSCNSLLPGLYFIRVTDKEGHFGVVKLVKE